MTKLCKGGGVAIVDFEDYKKVYLEHLHGVTSDGSPYYKQVTAPSYKNCRKNFKNF